MATNRYRASRKKLGSLNCILVEPDSGTPVRGLACLCHGFGASEDDLAGLATDLLKTRNSDRGIALLFPGAPIELDDMGMPGGRAWWHISIQKLIDSMEEGRYEQVRQQDPDGIDDARNALTETINASLSTYDLGYDRLLLGGFSQGAMLTIEAACLGLPKVPKALALFSGALIREQQWKPAIGRLRSCAILQSHGRMDQVLPFQTGLWLRDLLRESGCTVDFLEFMGPHTIPWESIEKLAALLDDITLP